MPPDENSTPAENENIQAGKQNPTPHMHTIQNFDTILKWI